MILLADANIILDFGGVGGLRELACLGPLEVLDNVLEEAKNSPQLPNLEQDLRGLGVQIVELKLEWQTEIQSLKKGGMSFPDSSCLYYGKTFERTVLSNDAALRRNCAVELVEVHGSLWMMEQLYTQNLCESHILCEWLRQWSDELGSFLPRVELACLRQLIGC